MDKIWQKLNVALLISILLAIIGDRGLLEYLTRPDLRCHSLPPYETSTEAVSGVVVENRGKEMSNSIVINISTGDEIITDLKLADFVNTPELKEGGVNQTSAIYSLTRLSPNKSGTIFVKTVKSIKPRAICEDETGLARSADSTPEQPWLAKGLQFLGLASIIYLFLTMTSPRIVELLKKQQNTVD